MCRFSFRFSFCCVELLLLYILHSEKLEAFVDGGEKDVMFAVWHEGEGRRQQEKETTPDREIFSPHSPLALSIMIFIVLYYYHYYFNSF